MAGTLKDRTVAQLQFNAPFANAQNEIIEDDSVARVC